MRTKNLKNKIILFWGIIFFILFGFFPNFETKSQTCGNAKLDPGEECDCGIPCPLGAQVCRPPGSLGECTCSFSPTSCNKNGICESGETCYNCASDCYCGNLTCDPGENKANCPQDCGGKIPLPKELEKEFGKVQEYYCEKEIAYGKHLFETEKHLAEFLARLISFKEAARALLPSGIRVIELAGDCKSEYCEGKCECKDQACVKVKLTVRMKALCIIVPPVPIGLACNSYTVKEKVKCIEGKEVDFKKNVGCCQVCVGVGEVPIECSGFFEIEKCGRCCCESEDYDLVNSWSKKVKGKEVEIEGELYYSKCENPNPPPEDCECQRGFHQCKEPGEYCNGCQCVPGPPEPPEKLKPVPPGGKPEPSLCEPKECQGNPCVIHDLGTELAGKEKEKEAFKKAFEELLEMEKILDQLMNQNILLSKDFALWYAERERASLFDCYTLKEAKIPGIPVAKCPFWGLSFYVCKP